MSETSPAYVLQPEVPGTEPPGFDSHPAALPDNRLNEIREYLSTLAQVKARLQSPVPPANEQSTDEWLSGMLAVAMNELDRLTARVAQQQAELGSQEVQMLRLVQESNRLKNAIRAATSQQMSAAEREAYTTNTNGAGTRGAFGAGEIMGRVSLAQGLLNLFDL